MCWSSPGNIARRANFAFIHFTDPILPQLFYHEGTRRNRCWEDRVGLTDTFPSFATYELLRKHPQLIPVGSWSRKKPHLHHQSSWMYSYRRVNPVPSVLLNSDWWSERMSCAAILFVSLSGSSPAYLMESSRAPRWLVSEHLSKKNRCRFSTKGV